MPAEESKNPESQQLYMQMQPSTAAATARPFKINLNLPEYKHYSKSTSGIQLSKTPQIISQPKLVVSAKPEKKERVIVKKIQIKDIE